MHLLIRGRKGFQIVRSHPVQLQLEGTSWLQVPIYSVFLEPIPVPVSEELRELLVLQCLEGDPSDAAVLQFFSVTGTEVPEYLAHAGVVRVTFVFDANVEDMNGFLDTAVFVGRSLNFVNLTIME